MRFLLDTTFVVDYLRGDEAAGRRFAQLIEAADEPYINEVVLCEVAVGVPSPEDPAFVGLVRALTFVQPPPDAALRAGRWRAMARAHGFTLSLADALIASAAESLDAAVLTRNARDFRLTPVSVESY